MRKNFLSIWLTYWAAIVLLPVKSIYSATIQAFFLQLTFVFLVLAGYSVTKFILNFREVPKATSFGMPRALTLIKLALGMSLFGFILLIYDKIYIQNIDYSQGLAFARGQWRKLGGDRAGQASSVFSALGYLIGSSYYVAAMLAITEIKVLSTAQRIRILLACFAMAVANSVITGGRSNILLLGVFIFAAMGSRKQFSFRKLLECRMQRWMIIIATVLIIWYITFVFYQRADASGLNGKEYMLTILPYLGLEPIEWYKNMLDDGVLSSLSGILVLTASYLTHSFSTTAAIMDGPIEDKTIIGAYAVNILSKLGLANQPSDEWFLSGRFPSFPGALWHQFGVIGFVMGSLLLGTASAIAKAWGALRPTWLLPMGAYIIADVVLILTPLLFAGDFLSFPFICSSLLFLALFQKCLQSKFFKSCFL